MTAHTCEEAVGLMPNPEEGCADLKRIFYDHIFFFDRTDFKKSWRFTVALSGVHTIGSMHPENSGYQGQWSESPGTFNNDYYIKMVQNGWGPLRNIG